MDYVVYVLVDPRTKDVRYVGSTRQAKSRRSDHIKMKSARAGTPLATWFEELRVMGLSPKFKIVTRLSGCYADRGARHIERGLIREYSEAHDGHLILNVAHNPRYRSLSY